MRFSFLLFLLVGFTLPSAVAQKKPIEPVLPVLPVDSISGLIDYSGVVDVKDTKSEVLYQRIQDWFRKYYKNPDEVIRENDAVKMSITGKPRFRITNPPDKSGLKTDAGVVQYTITMTAKDGRYRYELSSFNWKQPSYFACERWMETPFSKSATTAAEYLQQLDNTAREVIAAFKAFIAQDSHAKSKDDW